jgi:hypothetical protein
MQSLSRRHGDERESSVPGFEVQIDEISALLI